MDYIENIEEEKVQTQSIFRDMIKYAPSKIIGMLGNAIVIPIYTNLLLPEQYGLYSLSIAFLSFLCIIFSDWVGLSGLRFFKRAQLADDLSQYLSTIILILGINLTLMFTLSAIFQHKMIAFFKVSPIYFWAVLFLIIPVALRALLFQILRAQIKPISYTFSTVLNQFMTIGLGIFFIKTLHIGAMSLLLAMGVAITITDIILMFQSKISKFIKKPKLSWGVLFPIILYGIPLAATSLSGWIINQSNKVVMNTIKGFTDVAYIGVGYGATMSILMALFSIITVASIPRFYSMFESKIDVRPIVARFTGYFLLISLPIVTVMALYPHDVLTMLNTNEKFMRAAVLIPYFSFGTLFLCLTDYTTLQYHLANKTWIGFIIKLLSGLTNVALTIYLVPICGLKGVGIAMLATNCTYYFLSSVIRLPGYAMTLPTKQVACILTSLTPVLLVYYFLFRNTHQLTSGLQMSLLLALFYLVYQVAHKIFKPDSYER